jgi:hypothetical protein
MRTTVELPAELLRAAKARSAERGESLKTLLTRAVQAEVGAAGRTARAERVALPLFGDPSRPVVEVTNADLERALADENAVSTMRRQRRRAHDGRRSR